jgi:hypothetical protein
MQRCQRGELWDTSNRSNSPTASQHLSTGMTFWQDPQNTVLCSRPQLPSEATEEARRATEQGIWAGTGCAFQPTTTLQVEGRAPVTGLAFPRSTCSTPELSTCVWTRFHGPWRKKQVVDHSFRDVLANRIRNDSKQSSKPVCNVDRHQILLSTTDEKGGQPKSIYQTI